MQSITVLCVGKLKEPAYRELCAEYQKRLGAFAQMHVVELPETKLPEAPSPAQITAALAEEASRIRRAIPQGAKTVALCVEGRAYTSPAFAQAVDSLGAAKLVFLVGGSNGLDETLKREAHLRVSFSAMTFPHHLFRVMLLEQLYRAYMITTGRTYHK